MATTTTTTIKLCVRNFLLMIVLCHYAMCLGRGGAAAKHKFFLEEPEIPEEKPKDRTQIR